ncbi:MAG: hypothetical protein ACU0CC_13855 [Sagittula sp.]|uniref:hypothetical protein n=1 Tax=Sagittula sp. TaxID=2038081 RepID=UPI004058B2F2
MRAFLVFFALLTARPALAETLIQNACLGNAYESCFVLIEGQIEPGLTDRLRSLIETEGVDGGVIYLNSPGGTLGEALRLGRYIREQGYDTALGGSDGIPRHTDGKPIFLGSEGPSPGRCESACAYVFMGGVRRFLSERDKLGLHQFFAPGQQIGGEVAQKFSGDLVAYMVEMGVDARIFTLASAQDSTGMYYVTQPQAEEYDLVTRVGYDAFFLEPYKDGLIAASKRIDPPQPYDGVDQMSFYCRAGQPYALLHASVHALSPEERGSPIFWTDNTEQKLPEDAVSVRVDGEDAYLTIRISPPQAQAMAAAGTFAIGAGYGRVIGGNYVAAKKPTPLDRRMLDAAFRFCID